MEDIAIENVLSTVALIVHSLIWPMQSDEMELGSP